MFDWMRCPLLIYQTGLQSNRDCFSTGSRVELTENRRHVMIDRLGGDKEALADFRVA